MNARTRPIIDIVINGRTEKRSAMLAAKSVTYSMTAGTDRPMAIILARGLSAAGRCITCGREISVEHRAQLVGPDCGAKAYPWLPALVAELTTAGAA